MSSTDADRIRGYGSIGGEALPFAFGYPIAKLPWVSKPRSRTPLKDTEGRLQAAAGDITGDDHLKVEGEAKQVQAQLIDTAGTVKDKVQQVAASLGDAIDGLADKGN